MGLGDGDEAGAREDVCCSLHLAVFGVAKELAGETAFPFVPRKRGSHLWRKTLLQD